MLGDFRIYSGEFQPSLPGCRKSCGERRADRTRRIDSDIPLSLWHKSMAELAGWMGAGLANSSPGADCIHRVSLAVESVGGTPHGNHLSHGSRRSFAGQWGSGTLILSVILLRQDLAHRNGKTLLELAVAVALVVVSLSLLISHISHRPHSPMYNFNFGGVLRGVCLVLSEPLPGSFSPDAGSLGWVFGVDYFDIARSSFILRLARLARVQKRGIRLIALLHGVCSQLVGQSQQCNDCQPTRGTWT